jgi:hypothetical protein
MKKFSLYIIVISLSLLVHSQEDNENKWRLSGYVKDMVTMNMTGSSDSLNLTPDGNTLDNLVHNRLNLTWKPNEKFQTQVEMRNRIFWGDQVAFYQELGSPFSYVDLIDVNDDFFDLSFVPINEDKWVVHSMIDRAYVQWREEGWELRVGRHRINWGINLAWNPNDIFNAYSFFDFDYEERPGSDAVRFQRFIGYAGGYELAFKITDNWTDFTGAGMYKWNFNAYDIQVIGGIMRENIVLGGGWAGNINLAGFKGELTYFEPLNDRDERTFISSLTVDYSFVNSLYLNGSVLYNSAGSEDSDLLQFQSTANLDVRSLSPYEWSTFLQTSYQFHPLITGSAAILYFPGQPGVFLGPSITWSIVSNLDLDLIGQFFLDAEPTDVKLLYARIKYSF